MQSIDRVMSIINVFIEKEPNRYLSITELSEKSNLPMSSLHRILQAMIKHKMIKQDKKRKLYSLGSLWLEYGLKIYDTMDYISHIRPELEQLMKTVEASVYLTRPDGEESIVIERIDCISQTIRAYDKLGLRKPLYEGIANLAMLAHMDQEIQQKMLSRTSYEENEYYSKLKQIRQNGYAIGEDEWSQGLITIATPIINHYKNIVGAISIKFINTIDERTKEEAIKQLINTGNKVSWKVDANF